LDEEKQDKKISSAEVRLSSEATIRMSASRLKERDPSDEVL
jgi:hypothetical protein